MGIVRCDNGVALQIQCADKSIFQLRQEMKRPAEKSHVSADWFAAGKSANCLVYDCLKDGSSQVRFERALVNQGLDVGFCKHAAAGGNRI